MKRNHSLFTCLFSSACICSVLKTSGKALFAFLLVCLMKENVSAGNNLWIGPGVGTYLAAGNWSNGLPVVTDTLVFLNTATVTGIPNFTSVASVYILTSAAVNLQSTAGYTLTLTSGVNALAIASSGSLTISNLSMALSGTSSDSGSITVDGGGTLNFSGVNQTIPPNITVNSGGELQLSGATAGADVFSNPAPVISGGTLTIAGKVSGSTGCTPTYVSGSGCTLQYKATANINTGAELPASVDNLIDSANAGLNTLVTLKSNVTVTGTATGLYIRNGVLQLSGKTLTLNGIANSTYNGASGGRIFADSAATINFSGNAAGAIGTLNFVTNTNPASALGTLNMNRAGAVVTIASPGLKIRKALNLTNGIINMPDGVVLYYEGSPGNLTGSTTGYVSLLNQATTSYGFQLGLTQAGTDTVTMAAGTYTLPVGKRDSLGNPPVSGYRPVQVSWSTAAKNYFEVGLLDNVGNSSPPGNAGDVPLSGNNRAGYIAAISTNVAAYGFSMSYLNSDFSSAPIPSTVPFLNWTGSAWYPVCQSSNTPGSPNYVSQSAFTKTSGTVALGSSMSTSSQSACASYTWNGSTYTSSGTYTFHTTNAAGCDSAALLKLSIYNSTSASSLTACNSYLWNGTNYTTSGDKVYHTINTLGCDSAATLHLTILDSCNNLSYTWNGGTSDFQLPANWTPSRLTPASNDTLIFQNISQTIVNVPEQTIAAMILQVSGGPAVINLQGAEAGNTLTLSNANNALLVNSNCALTLSTNMAIVLSGTSNNSGTITLDSGGILNFAVSMQTIPSNITVNMGGELILSGHTAIGADVFSAPAPFISGGTLTIAGMVSASAGAAPIFTSGSTLQYHSTANVNTGIEFPPSVDNLVVSTFGSPNYVVTMNSNAVITGSVTGLEITNGVLALNGKTLTIKGAVNGIYNAGRILADTGATINFSGNVAGTIGALYFMPGSTLGKLTMNRPGSILTIGSPGLKVSSELNLAGGIINMPDSATLTYTGRAANLTGNTSSYISFLDAVYTNYGFCLGDSVTPMPAATSDFLTS